MSDAMLAFTASPWFMLMIVWTIIWKAIALWISARRNQKIWFVVLLLVNTIGILEILYIFVFSKMGQSNQKNVGAETTKMSGGKIS